MFKATMPFKDEVTSHPEEPSLRIGRKVPADAVNLAYYYNPVATDAEKVLTSDAPRNTIDHRVEEAYRYLFDQSTKDDDLFPGFVNYEDAEGYTGKLGRMYVRWHEEAHIENKFVEATETIITSTRGDVPKAKSYKDADGYEGTMYFDSADYTVTKTKTIVDTDIVARNVRDHELNYHEIFGAYISPAELDKWMKEPATRDTLWPHTIEVETDKCKASGGDAKVQEFVNAYPNPYDKATGTLIFHDIEYEPVYVNDSILVEDANKDVEIKTKFKTEKIKLSDYAWPSSNGTLTKYMQDSSITIEDKKEKIGSIFDNLMNITFETSDSAYTSTYNAAKDRYECDALRAKYEAEYNAVTGEYDYKDIKGFLYTAFEYDGGTNSITHGFSDDRKGRCKLDSPEFLTVIQEAMDANKDIAIYAREVVGRLKIDGIIMNNDEDEGDDLDDLPTNVDYEKAVAWNLVYYNYSIGGKASEGEYQYNVTVNYETDADHPLKKENKITREEPAEYMAECKYSGLARRIWYDYDGMAYYRGSVTKGNGVGNMNTEGDNELLMYSDENGYLRRPVTVTDEFGNTVTKNFYRVESDYIYLTDVFKDGIACFYKYPLKKPIYDYRGPDENGFYEGDAVKIHTSAFKDVPKGYVHNMKLKVAETEVVDTITDDYHLASKTVPKKYTAELYTSFISGSTDTFHAIYNAFNDSDDNEVLDSGEIEEIYNYPFMVRNYDFFLETVDKKARINKIRLPKPKRFADTRRYVSFSYQICAEHKKTGAQYISETRRVSILNKDYALACEYDQFEDRAMIISPILNGTQASPFDIILYDMAAAKKECLVKKNPDDYLFTATIVNLDNGRTPFGAVNVKCSPDGSGYLTAETTVDTGFMDGNGRYVNKLSLDVPYLVEEGYIYPALKVKCMDARHIKINAPRQDKLLESWYPMVQFGHYSQILDQYGAHIKVCYSMPEYDTQHYSVKYGLPYVDVTNEQVTIMNSHMIKTLCHPLFIKEGDTTVQVFKRLDDEVFSIKIKNISFADGVVITEDAISENDDIICTYTYIEENYVYRGFWRNAADFARIDLNPNMYHTYSDLTYTPSQVSPTKNLFNKVIYFFMRPTIEFEVEAENDSLIFDINDDYKINKKILENTDTLYHQIDNPEPESDHDIYIGSIYIRQNTSLHSTVIVDGRTRGGGVIESMPDDLRSELEPESDYYLDIGYYDGKPYQENGVIIVRLDNRILKEFGGRFTHSDVELKVKRWLGLGVYPIIEYVNTVDKFSLPQYTLKVEDSYTNVTDEIPEIYLETVDI